MLRDAEPPAECRDGSCENDCRQLRAEKGPRNQINAVCLVLGMHTYRACGLVLDYISEKSALLAYKQIRYFEAWDADWGGCDDPLLKDKMVNLGETKGFLFV